MSDEKKSCLRGENLTKVFGLGRKKNVAVDHVNLISKKAKLYRLLVNLVVERQPDKNAVGFAYSDRRDVYFRVSSETSVLPEEERILEEYSSDFQDPYSSYNILTK
jgi:hypothetical protein